MEVTKGDENLSSDEFDLLLFKSSLLTEMIEEITTLDVLKEEVESIFVLEHVIHGEDEWVLSLEQDILLSSSVYDLTLLDEDIFVDSLHSVLFSVFGVHNQENLTE